MPVDALRQKSRSSGPRSRRGGSPLQRFEWQLRADARLSAKARLAWLVTALSRKKPASMSVANLATQLGASRWVVTVGLRRLVDLGLFERTPKGYARCGRKSDFARQVRGCESINLAVRVAWLLTDLLSAAKDGRVSISLAEMATELNADRQRVSIAVRKLVVDLGLFHCSWVSGRKNTYSAAIPGQSSRRTAGPRQADLGGDGPTINPDGTPVDDADAEFADVDYEEYFARKYARRAR